MPNTSTSYMGLQLRNPVIVASSGLTRSLEKVKECEAAGAGAVVLKSLFEESLAQKDFGMKDSLVDHTEAYDYYYARLEKLYGGQEYTDMIREIKAETTIPIIASINCVSADWWPDYALQMESAGADAIELNVFTTATDLTMDSNRLEELYVEIVSVVKRRVGIPVALKIGPWFSALPHLSLEFAQRKLDGLVLFNRFTQPDIDINELKPKTSFSFSTGEEVNLPLRWTALMSHYLPLDICATTGVKSAEDMIKLLLAGASSVQVASVLYEKGLGTIGEMVAGLENWMGEKGFETIGDFKGKLSFHETASPAHYLRAQFMEKISEVE